MAKVIVYLYHTTDEVISVIDMVPQIYDTHSTRTRCGIKIGGFEQIEYCANPLNSSWISTVTWMPWKEFKELYGISINDVPLAASGISK